MEIVVTMAWLTQTPMWRGTLHSCQSLVTKKQSQHLAVSGKTIPEILGTAVESVCAFGDPSLNSNL